MQVFLLGCGGSPLETENTLTQRTQQDLLIDNCTQCHAWTPPEILPRGVWQRTIEKMYKLANERTLADVGRPINLPLAEALSFFDRAPEQLDAPAWKTSPERASIQFERQSLADRFASGLPAGVANIRLLDLFDDLPGPELVVCDMLSGWVSWAQPSRPDGGLSRLARLSHPAHSEAVDLDQDGRMDLIVAELGSPVPTDDRVGGVVWLKRTGNRHFEVVRLLSHIGRVADVQAADFDADGDIDLVVAEFGWIVEGSVLYLENTSNGGAVTAESFQPHVLDERHGAIHVPVVDLNRDGRPDIVALLAQEHETVVAYLNQGAGLFEQQDLFTARHPHWGFSGIEPIDLDQDGDLDFLLTNGDTLDDQVQFKPYQGVAWIEDNGELPYELHWIDTYYGAHRAEAADMDGDGDLDIVVSSFLPGLDESRRKGMRLPGVCWYEQKPGRKFVPHVLADLPCDQATLVIGDVDGDGRPDVITGVLQIRASKRKRPPVDVWLNRPRSER